MEKQDDHKHECTTPTHGILKNKKTSMKHIPTVGVKLPEIDSKHDADTK